MDIKIGQEMIGKFQTSNGKGCRPFMFFPHGTVTELHKDGFTVKYPTIKGNGWRYKFSDIGKLVYAKDTDIEKQEAARQEEEIDNARLGYEEEPW